MVGLLPRRRTPSDAKACAVRIRRGRFRGEFQTRRGDAFKSPQRSLLIPIKIQIPNVGVDVSISDPNNADSEILNQYLLKGAVRYPGSGYPGSGNLFIFGHSSTLGVVHNQAYKAFNKIENLKAGDEISVYSTSTKYIYKVRDVRTVKASQEEVDLTTKENMLTISTCDLIGSTNEYRYVVRADYVRKENI